MEYLIAISYEYWLAVFGILSVLILIFSIKHLNRQYKSDYIGNKEFERQHSIESTKVISISETYPTVPTESSNDTFIPVDVFKTAFSKRVVMGELGTPVCEHWISSATFMTGRYLTVDEHRIAVKAEVRINGDDTATVTLTPYGPMKHIAEDLIQQGTVAVSLRGRLAKWRNEVTDIVAFDLIIKN